MEELSRCLEDFPGTVDDCVEELESADVIEGFNSVHGYVRSVQELRQIAANRTQRRTEDGLLVYKKKCAAMEDKVRDVEAMLKMERAELKKLEKLKARHPNLTSTIKTAEERFEKTRVHSKDSHKILSRSMKGFERKKLLELKRVTMGMISDEMWFHAHALELYTRAYGAIERTGGTVSWKQPRLKFTSTSCDVENSLAARKRAESTRSNDEVFLSLGRLWFASVWGANWVANPSSECIRARVLL